MKIIELKSTQIITLNDYPVHSIDVLKDYIRRCSQGEDMPLVPVIKKDRVKKHLSVSLLKKLEKFEEKNPEVEYFMLDGSHRTIALTVTNRRIKALILDDNEDFAEAKKIVSTGQLLENEIFDDTIEKNCKVLNEHFLAKPNFQTVEKKTQKMIREEYITQEMINASKKESSLRVK